MYLWQISFLLPGDLSFSYKNCFDFIESTNYVSVSVNGYHMHTILGLSRWYIATKVKVPKPTILPRSLLNSNLYNKWKSNNNAIQYTLVCTMQLTDLFAASSMWHLRMICFPTNTVWLFVLSSGSMNGLPEPRIPLVTPTDLKYSGFFDWCRNLFPCSIAASLPKCLSEYLPWRAEADGSIVGSFCCQPDPVKVEICISDESSL